VTLDFFVTEEKNVSDKHQLNVPAPLSAKDYVHVALIMLVVGVVLLFMLVVWAPRLIPGGTLDKFYYIVLLVWGLISAVVLFGVVRSYARITYRNPPGGLAVELGGAAAFAALVVIGGFVLVPKGTLNLTVRPHGPDIPLITWGKIRVEFGANAPTVAVNESGEADFKGIPREFLGAKVKVLPIIDRYKSAYQEKTVTGEVLDLDLELPETQIKGRVFPVPAGKHVLTVLAQGEIVKPVLIDEYGAFEMLVHKNPDDSVRFTVCADGWRVYDDLQPVDNPQLHLRKRDQRCNN
jgi:hypothetical protein